LSETSTFIENISHAAAHARGEIPSAGSEHQNQSVRHVFAAVVADTFNNRGCAGIANRKALARHSVEERFSTGRAVKHDIADDDIFLGLKAGPARRINNDLSARQTLSYVIVGFPFQRQRHTL